MPVTRHVSKSNQIWKYNILRLKNSFHSEAYQSTYIITEAKFFKTTIDILIVKLEVCVANTYTHIDDNG